MHWYDGTIAEAVNLSKQRNAIFVVFIEGDNDLTAEMLTTIDEHQVVTKLSDPNLFLAIKLKSGSVNYTHFAQIYQFVPVPSLFFIGQNGTPLEVVCGGVQPADLATRIDRILAEHFKEVPAMGPPKPSQSTKEKTVAFINAESSSSMQKPQAEAKSSSEPPSKIQKTEHTSSSGKEYDIVCTDDVCVRVPRPRVDEAGPSGANVGPSGAKVGSSGANVQSGANVGSSEASVVPSSANVGSSGANVGSSGANVVPSGANVGSSGANVPSGASVTKPSVVVASVAVKEPVTPNNKEVVQETPSLEEKVDKAKELIEARRREKAAKEKEMEIQKELERRARGQGVNELKTWQQDQELKHIQEERKREKMENNLARQRILEQIAQDRAERRARDAPTPAQPAPPADTQSHTSGDTAGVGGAGGAGAGAGAGAGRTRIQFKLPDGGAHTAHFPSAGTLQVVHEYVTDQLQLSHSRYSLWTAFPRRELTDPSSTLQSLQLTPSAALLILPRRQNDTVAEPSRFANIIAVPLPRRELTEPSSTLQSLQLTPSAALLILPRRQHNTVAEPSRLANIIALLMQLFTQFVLQPSQQLYTWVASRVSAAPRRPPQAPADGALPPIQPSQVRRRGNVHRLHEEKNDDDNNTWNGNSTQQM